MSISTAPHIHDHDVTKKASAPAPRWRIGIAGSSQHTQICAAALAKDPRLMIAWVLTPAPQPQGRQRVLTPNPLHQWAEENHVPTAFVPSKLSLESVRAALSTAGVSEVAQRPDILLVIDFGYYVPTPLLGWPSCAPVNIHPSALPKWRGSSPGQFTLLFGEKTAAVSVIHMTKALDAGAIYWQEEFAVEPTWTTSEYYQFAFTRVAANIASILVDIATQRATPQPQPIDSPTMVARRLTRGDGYIEWERLYKLLDPANQAAWPFTAPTAQPEFPPSPLFLEVSQMGVAWPNLLAQASLALAPWPGLWTVVQTNKGTRRLKLLELRNTERGLELQCAQLEGERPKRVAST